MKRFLFGLLAVVLLPAGALAQWDGTKPATSSALLSADVRNNFQALEKAVGGINLLADPTFIMWPAGDAATPAHWQRSGTGNAIARTGTGLGDTNRKIGPYAAKLTSGAIAAARLFQDIIPAATYDDGFDQLSFSAAAWVRCTSASVGRIFLDDGVTETLSSFHTGGSTFELLTVTQTLGATATRIRFGMRVEGGAQVCHLSGPVVLFGPIPPKYFHAPVIGYGFFKWHQTGNATTGTRKAWSDSAFNRPFIVKRVDLWVTTAPTGQALIVDCNHWDGAAFTTMFATRPQIAAGATAGGADPDGTYRYRSFLGWSGGSQTDALLDCDVDQIGSGAAGAELYVQVSYQYFLRPLDAFVGSTLFN